MRVVVHRKAVNLLLYRGIFQLPEVVGIILLEYGDRSAVARCGNPLQSGVELHHVWTFRYRQEGNWLVLLQIEDSHHFVPFARQESPTVLRVKCHSMIALTTSGIVLTTWWKCHAAARGAPRLKPQHDFVLVTDPGRKTAPIF